jgi:hypothetical protein
MRISMLKAIDQNVDNIRPKKSIDAKPVLVAKISEGVGFQMDEFSRLIKSDNGIEWMSVLVIRVDTDGRKAYLAVGTETESGTCRGVEFGRLVKDFNSIYQVFLVQQRVCHCQTPNAGSNDPN